MSKATMTVAEVETLLKDVLVGQLEVDPASVRPEARVITDFHADSLAVVELVLALEEAFEIEISEEDTDVKLKLGGLRGDDCTVKMLTDYIVDRLSTESDVVTCEGCSKRSVPRIDLKVPSGWITFTFNECSVQVCSFTCAMRAVEGRLHRLFEKRTP